MAKSKKEIINDIDNHLQKSGKRYYSDFYIGITNDIHSTLPSSLFPLTSNR